MLAAIPRRPNSSNPHDLCQRNLVTNRALVHNKLLTEGSASPSSQTVCVTKLNLCEQVTHTMLVGAERAGGRIGCAKQLIMSASAL